MGMTSNVLRNSINAFFRGYHSFTSIAALLVFPASISVLVSESLAPTSGSVLSTISARFESMFRAAGFPASDFFSLLNLKLSQTVFSFTFALPFTLTFLLVAKACIIQIFRDTPHGGRVFVPSFSKYLSLYPSLLLTHLLNSFAILSSNAATFSLLFLLFNAIDLIGLKSSISLFSLSVTGAVLYSIVIATATVICNLAIIISGMENCSGYMAMLKACILIRGRVATALALALPTNAGMAMAEALFQFRVMGQFRLKGKINYSIMSEVFLIAYIHAILVVFEIIVSCMFYRSCRFENYTDREDECEEWREELEPEEKTDFDV